MVMKSIAVVFSVFSIWVLSNVDAAPAPAVDCSSLVLNMADCLTFVSAGSTVDKPEGTCCSGLKTVVKTNVGCLCETFKNSAQFGVTLNITKAMSLPNACHVSAPSVSNCGLSLVNGAAPANSPLGALSPSVTAGAPTSVAGAPTSVAGANGLAPAPTPTPGANSGAAALAVSLGSVLVAIAAASFA